MKARAPGKVMLAGEYAVLEGGSALVMAVDRVAYAETDTDASSESPEVTATLALALREGLLSRAHRGVRVDTRALASDGRKLGLGSSAAGCVAALAAAMASEGRDVAAQRDALARTARRGHRAAQGGGSGVDVLASALGGVLHVTPAAGEGEPTLERVALPTGLYWAVLWTGTPVRTSELIACVRAHAARDGAAHDACFDALRTATGAVTSALRASDPRATVAAMRTHGEAMDALGAAAGAPIVTDAMRSLAARIARYDAACKPSGAGGGDIVFVVADTDDGLARAVADGRSLGFEPVELAIDPQGAGVVAEAAP